MSYRTLDVASGANGGAIKLFPDPRRVRKITITVLNPTAVTHAAFFAKTRRELTTPGPVGIAGIAVVAVANNVATFTVNGVAYTTFVTDWTGELWAASDVVGLQVDVQEGIGEQ
jgi:hypothetical protein